MYMIKCENCGIDMPPSLSYDLKNKKVCIHCIIEYATENKKDGN